MRRSIMTSLVLGALVSPACKKGDDAKSEAANPTSKTQETTARTSGTAAPAPAGAQATGDPVAAVGVAAGGIEHDPAEGAAAVLTAVSGTVEVRRVGEPSFTAAKADAQLYAGDTIRTGDGGTATVTLADQSVVEVAEVSTLGIGTRAGTADPASSAALLGGLARFTVTPRAPGEGAFRVYTPAGVAVTKGTVYGLGVAASGEVKLGVESGAVDWLGLTAVEASPLSVEGGMSTTTDAEGSAATPVAWPADDWGTWRADADAKLEIGPAFDAHAQALAELETHLTTAYADLTAAADTVATFEASAAANLDKNDPAAYEASLPDGAATIDASFSLAGYIEALTWANASHATIATDLYVRHPDIITPTIWAPVAPRADASVLWPKRFDVTAGAYLEPLRTQYYVHHPRGRANAAYVGITVPEFYANITPPPVEAPHVRARIKTKIWMQPDIKVAASTRPVWIASPAANWRAGASFKPAPFRAKVGWYARPPELKTKVLLGADLKGTWDSKLTLKPPAPRASLYAAWSVPVGAKIKLAAPDLKAAAAARASFRAPGIGAGVRVGANVAPPDLPPPPDVKAKIGVKVPSVKIQAPAVKAGAAIKAKAGVGIGAGVKAGAGIKVKAPSIKIQAPSVKVKAKAGFRIGN
ncbi:MAG: FecR family protein [Kofleriaceae bacterium]|nr:FecR family protein [Kofleriaceae bacterium]